MKKYGWISIWAFLFMIPICAEAASFTGTYVLSDNRLEVLDLSNGKLKVSLVAYWPKRGAPNEHVGTAEGVANLKGNQAILYPATDLGPEEAEKCQILLNFTEKAVEVQKKEVGSACEFGANVSVEGKYLKSSAAIPKFSK